jgi:helix-turn-helix protein
MLDPAIVSAIGEQECPDGLLTQREAARLLKVSQSYLRESNCPKLLLPGHGERGRHLVRYLRADVMEWARARRT